MAKNMPPETLINLLASGDDAAWNDFFLNVPQAQALAPHLQQDLALAVLVAGASWKASGWNTSRASQKLWETARVSLISPDAKHYINAWLYALSLVWSVELPDMSLPDKPAEAAFALMECILNNTNPSLHPQEIPWWSHLGLVLCLLGHFLLCQDPSP